MNLEDIYKLTRGVNPDQYVLHMTKEDYQLFDRSLAYGPPADMNEILITNTEAEETKLVPIADALSLNNNKEHNEQ